LTLIANIGKGAVLSANCGKGITYGSDVLTNGDMEAWTATYCAQYQTVYDSFTTKPSAAEATIWNTFVASIVGTGEWAKLDILDIFSVHTNGDSEALKNWKNPGTFDPTLVNNPAFGINEGFTGNGSNAHINSNWNAAVNGINYVQNSASIGCYVRTNTAAGNKVEVGVWDASNRSSRILTRSSGDTCYVRINSTQGGSTANSDARGMWIGNRVLSTEQDLYLNKSRIINHSRGSSPLPNGNIYALAMNYQGSINAPSDRQLSMVFAGAGFTQTNVNNLTDAFEVAMDALGKGVI